MNDIKLPKSHLLHRYLNQWVQVDGDVSIDTHGGILARYNGTSIELHEILPVVEYVGEREAVSGEDPFPFWTRESYWDASDLETDKIEPALRACGTDPELWPELCALEKVLAMHRYGHRVDEGECGWARDVFPAKAYYWCRQGKRPVSGAYFDGADREFRRLMREHA
jgi:hypothetical protein